MFDSLATHLSRPAHVELHLGKTRVWNASGTQPGLEGLGPDAWAGDRARPTHHQGLVVLGAPVGHPDFVQAHLREALSQQHSLLEALRELNDLQSAWLFRLFCAHARANYLLRTVPPPATRTEAEAHDARVAACLADLLESEPLPPASIAVAQLLLVDGGLGVTSTFALASNTRLAVFRSSKATISSPTWSGFSGPFALTPRHRGLHTELSWPKLLWPLRRASHAQKRVNPPDFAPLRRDCCHQLGCKPLPAADRLEAPVRTTGTQLAWRNQCWWTSFAA